MLYVALCDLILNKPNGSPDLVNAGDVREFDVPPFQGSYPKWEALDAVADPDPAPVKPGKKSPTDIDKPYTGVRAV